MNIEFVNEWEGNGRNNWYLSILRIDKYLNSLDITIFNFSINIVW